MIELNFRKVGAYLVFNTGQVYSVRAGRFITGYKHRSRTNTYARITLRHKGQPVRVFVHRLVAALFCLPEGRTLQDVLGEGLEVNHMDGDSANNAADNLEWVKPVDNLAHAELARGLSLAEPRLAA
jgi:hypothetical protein